ncbi:MAG: helix-turn-helix domain-containing protein [Comamonas sp.]|nr:helix-turn-helix domain-containing protein [Comamonas sp.]
MTSEQLKAWRADMGLTQQASADALGVTLATFQQWERGTSFATGKIVTIDRRTALACAALRAELAPEGGAE